MRVHHLVNYFKIERDLFEGLVYPELNVSLCLELQLNLVRDLVFFFRYFALVFIGR